MDVIKLAPSFLWFCLTCGLIFYFRKQISESINVLTWRIKAGAPVKVSVFELGAVQVLPQTHRPLNEKSVRKDKFDEFHNLRKQFRDVSIFLVHRLSPSTEADQLYDVLIFLVPGLRYGSLLNVVSVEYYFGRYWDSNIFTSIDRASGFSISTSAFAPFMCTARITFNNSETEILHRYIDFEMGSVGAAPLSKGR